MGRLLDPHPIAPSFVHFPSLDTPAPTPLASAHCRIAVCVAVWCDSPSVASTGPIFKQRKIETFVTSLSRRDGRRPSALSRQTTRGSGPPVNPACPTLLTPPRSLWGTSRTMRRRMTSAMPLPTTGMLIRTGLTGGCSWQGSSGIGGPGEAGDTASCSSTMPWRNQYSKFLIFVMVPSTGG